MAAARRGVRARLGDGGGQTGTGLVGPALAQTHDAAVRFLGGRGADSSPPPSPPLSLAPPAAGDPPAGARSPDLAASAASNRSPQLPLPLFLSRQSPTPLCCTGLGVGWSGRSIQDSSEMPRREGGRSRSAAYLVLFASCLLAVAAASHQEFHEAAGSRTLLMSHEHTNQVHCSRERSRAAWKAIDEYLMPFVEKEKYELPSKCRLHPGNDMFREQEQHKIHFDINEWRCGFCKKAFRAEKFLDQHFHNRHNNLVDNSQGRCLADLCGALHCDLMLEFKKPKSKCSATAAARNRHLCEIVAFLLIKGNLPAVFMKQTNRFYLALCALTIGNEERRSKFKTNFESCPKEKTILGT
uniref:C2H2-type domain-containing protein n=1 Tax=Oryza rufipogon TaxID=4529 RepID=A0A0E0RFC2_ORYRU